MIVTKKQVLEAIILEPLPFKPGSFAKADPYTGAGPCSVCAVGAVLHGVLNCGYREVEENASEYCHGVYSAGQCERPEDIQEQLNIKNWLGALSLYFETLNRDWSEGEDPEWLRAMTYDFVATYFPNRLTLTKVY